MIKTLNFWKRAFGSKALADTANSSTAFNDVISSDEAQRIRGGDKEYVPLYELQQEPVQRQSSILLDFM